MNERILLLGYNTKLGETVEEMALEERDCEVWATDAASREEVEVDVRKMVERTGWPDWVINCAGRNRLAAIGGREREDWGLLVENVRPIYTVVDALVHMRAPAARVLSVASQTYRIPQTNTAMYCASKAALVQLTRVMARELAAEGWVINALAPGKIEDTDMARRTDEQVLQLRGWTPHEADAYALRNVPMRRFTTRKEVAQAIFAILELPSYINGTCIDMTGGA